MQDTAKYLVHADITTDGIVERSDVVGAVFGQTEGLLGDDLDLRDLQDASKVGRIDVDVDSQNGQSFGRITIATSLDQVETAILGAALETIDRVGPCRSTIEVRTIEDVRVAKRREVVDRAKSLLGEAFDESMRSSRDLVEEVRESVRVEDISEYEGLPAGPRVTDADAIVVVEGRADVLTLLRYGIKNAVAVEGTNVPEAVAELTDSRTVTAFFDGDRGGELIRKELAQVGDIDYVALAPPGRAVEDLARHEVMAALREKVSPDRLDDDPTGGPADEPTDRTKPSNDGETSTETTDDSMASADDSMASSDGATGATNGSTSNATTSDTSTADASPPTIEAPERLEEPDGRTEEGDVPIEETVAEPETLREHVRVVVGAETDRARLIDSAFGILDERDADAAFELLEEADDQPAALILDGELTQRVLDVAAQRGVDQIVADGTGSFVKQPTSVRVRTADQLLASNQA